MSRHEDQRHTVEFEGGSGSREPSPEDATAYWGGTRRVMGSTWSGGSRSAPMLPAPTSPQRATWYAGGSTLSGPLKRSCWKPLGSTWREWETDGNSRIRESVDDGSMFVNGCIPNWNKEAAIRMRSVLEHELTWAYYRMRRHEQHPQRKAVGEVLPAEALAEKMRFGRASIFQFWRDLRPPFAVLSAKRVDDGHGKDVPAQAVNHPDGELYSVMYECAIEYFAERLMDDKKANSTFDNKIHGIAQVRIPNTFPQKRPLHIVSWGQPTLNPPDNFAEKQAVAVPVSKGVPPEQWNPLANELGLNANSVRFAGSANAAREATRRLEHKKRIVKVPELQRLLLGCHASLPRLASKEQSLGRGLDFSSLPSQASTESAPPKVRKHTVFTPAVGFVTYAG